MVEELRISKGTIRIIVRENLGKRKICSRFVPHMLTDDQKVKWMEAAGDFITMRDRDSCFLRTIITGDETWRYQFDPNSKRQSMEWRSPLPKKYCCQKNKVKTMLIAFFDNDGIIHQEFVPVGQTANAAFYEEVLKRLLRRIWHVRL